MNPRITLGQKILLGALAVNLTILSLVFIISSDLAKKESKMIIGAETAATSIIFTQRETLAYTTKFSLWLAGQLTQRDVEIARALLTQRLNVVTEDGTTTGERAKSSYLNALRISDQILSRAPSGYLPPRLHTQFSEESEDFIDQLLVTSREMVVDYQEELDRNIGLAAQNRNRNNAYILILFILFILLSSLSIFWAGYSFSKQYKIARSNLKHETDALLIAKASLRNAQTSVKTLEELNASKNDFISTVNHELRTPLTSIIGYVEILKSMLKEDDSRTIRETADIIDRNASVLFDIVERILSLSNLDSLEQLPDFEKIYLPEIIQKEILILTPLIEEKGLLVKYNADTAPDFAMSGNSGQISQVIQNLLSNAIKFSPKQGHINLNLSSITCIRPNDFMRLEVEDEGIGIPPADIPKLFTRFYRASNAVSNQVKGTGLGLAIVAKILDLHKSVIRVESKVNEGSKFIIEFPSYLSDIDRYVLSNRSTVLYKAIVALESSSNDDLAQMCHQMSGALGFYSLENEMISIFNLQAWLGANPGSSHEVIGEKRHELLIFLENSYSNLMQEAGVAI